MNGPLTSIDVMVWIGFRQEPNEWRENMAVWHALNEPRPDAHIVRASTTKLHGLGLLERFDGFSVPRYRAARPPEPSALNAILEAAAELGLTVTD